MSCSHPNCNLKVYHDDKCILHSDKKNKDVDEFWNQIQTDLSSKYECVQGNEFVDEYKVSYDYVIFPKFQKDYAYDLSYESTIETSNFYFTHHLILENGICSENKEENPYTNKLIEKCYTQFNNCTFLDELDLQRYNFEKSVIFYNCIFKKQINLNNILFTDINFRDCKFNNQIFNLSNRVFNDNFVFINCENIKTLNLENTHFKKSASFSDSKLNEIKLEETYFEGMCIFVKTHFKEDIIFKYCIFEDNTFFNDAVIYNTIDIKHSVFKKEVTFLDIVTDKNTITCKNISNRETARIIKNSFEKQNNIIEANKFYAVEMQMRKDELLCKDFFEWLIFWLHGITSKHSQSWILPLFWIIIISILGIENNLIDSLCCFYFSDSYFDSIAKSFYAIFKFDKENINFYNLLIKLIMGYLIYQFIISIRQNTRRK